MSMLKGLSSPRTIVTSRNKMRNFKLSFEFFPPKTDAGKEKIESTRAHLSRFNPEFFSVTYGAGGSTRDNTRDAVLSILDAGSNVAPHLSFGGDGEEQVLALLREYVSAGLDRLVALRGDIPSGMGATRLVYASELVALIREKFADHFTIAVACYPEIHPQAPSYEADIQFLKQKFDAGANFGITQYFYNADAFDHFLEHCEKAGITRPIYPGIMPITNGQNLLRFSDNCGAEVPRWIRQKLEDFKDDRASLIKFGEEVVTSLCEKLIASGAQGFHFYTMNQGEPTAAICTNLGLSSTGQTR